MWLGGGALDAEQHQLPHRKQRLRPSSLCLSLSLLHTNTQMTQIKGDVRTTAAAAVVGVGVARRTIATSSWS